MSVEVIRPGLLTSVQGLGSPGQRRYGVRVGGAMDSFALRVANLLVGNSERAGALEMTLMGPHLRFLTDAVLAVCGADMQPAIGGEALPCSRPVAVRGGTELRFRVALGGCRAYLAVAGGLSVAEVLGSDGSDGPAGWSGWNNRPLRAGDCLYSTGESSSVPFFGGLLRSRMTDELPWSASRWFVRIPSAGTGDAATAGTVKIRVVRGRQWDWFEPASQQRFFTEEFTVTNHSNRVGYRLSGPILETREPRQLLSEGVSAGAIQIPPAGHPLILMADSPVTGGYPKIAHVAAVDLSTLAQLPPGSKLRFREIAVAEAEALYRTREAELASLRTAIQLRLQCDG